jgi:DNA repair and recombination protein RAD54B
VSYFLCVQVKSRAPGCNKSDLELGQGRAQKLSEIGQQFILRRDATVIAKFLPPKSTSSTSLIESLLDPGGCLTCRSSPTIFKGEYVVFVAPTTLQLSILRQLMRPETVEQFVRDGQPGKSKTG